MPSSPLYATALISPQIATRQVRSTTITVLAYAAPLVIWWALSTLGLLNPQILPAPDAVLVALGEEFASGRLIADVVASLRRVFVGFGIAVILAVPLGVLAALSPVARLWLRPWIETLRPIPPIAWIPIALLWFGFGDPAAYFLVGLGAFFPAFTNAFVAFREIEQGFIDVARCHGARPGLLFRSVMLPQALPTLCGGLKTALGVAWMVVITAELVGVQSGLGYMIQVSRSQLQAERVVGGMLIIGMLGLGLTRIADLIERRLTPWKGRGRELAASVDE